MTYHVYFVNHSRYSHRVHQDLKPAREEAEHSGFESRVDQVEESGAVTPVCGFNPITGWRTLTKHPPLEV